ATERAAKAKAIGTEKFEQAEQAFQQHDYTAAKRLVDEADAADPNQPATINLRGEILLAQKDFDGAENAFKQAAKIDPKFREAQYNLAQIPFKKKDYTKARDRYEALFNNTPAPGGDKNQAAQIIKFKIYLTLLLEGKDSRAQKMMEQFQFTGDTPALYYAQAAWEFKHNNNAKANDWIVSAKKIYSPALNMVFADSFYDVGWLQQPQNVAAAPVTPQKDVAKTETVPPSIEPSPIPAPAIALNKSPKAPEIAPQKSATETTTQPPPSSQTVAKNEKAPGPVTTNSPSVEMPSASNAQPSETHATLPKEPETTTQPPSVTANGPVTANAQNPPNSATTTNSNAVTQQNPAPTNKAPAPATNSVVSTPATVLAPATVQQSSTATANEDQFDLRSLIVYGGFAAGGLLLAWVVFSEFRRRMNVSVYRSPATASGPSFDALEPETAVEKVAAPKRIAGGPPQVSLHLKASEPSVRRGPVPFSKTNRPFGSNGGTPTTIGAAVENLIPRAPISEPKIAAVEAPPAKPAAEIMAEPERSPVAEFDQESVSEPIVAMEKVAVADVEAEMVPEPITEVGEFSSVGEPQVIEDSAEVIESFDQIPAASTEEPLVAETSAWTEPSAPEPVWTPTAPEPVWTPEPAWTPAVYESSTPVFETAGAAEEIAQPVAENFSSFESVGEPVVIEPEIAPEPVSEISATDTEPVAQGQPIPYQVPAFETDSPMAEVTKPEPEELPAHPVKGVVTGTSMAGVGALRHSVESPSFAPQVISTEPLAQQPTTPATMPLPNQPTPAPSIRPSPMTGGAPQTQGQAQAQPTSGMQTAVQLTFSFEIASLQLTPSFKMGALQLKPTSKIVTMRLAPSQQPQPAMNLQVTFEIATVQTAGGGIGQIRLTPSQQQRPSVISSPAFNIAGLQLLSGSDAGAVQLTPSQQGQASVHVTGRFQIATVEFSPSFEIASLVLNSTSKSVSVQLPGAGPSAVEGAPVFEIANVQVTGNGEIGMMQLNAQGSAPKAA
ncbi:MAG TPA: tetratricopeptide repeat protein, partial [Chthoniobacterales bacterium]